VNTATLAHRNWSNRAQESMHANILVSTGG
jgi:hypothetical protein